jgi:pimeloyl-ACP methyl ester carboxylesterase
MTVVETRISVEVSTGTMAGLHFAPAGKDQAEPALIFLHANGFCASTYRALLAALVEEMGQAVIGLDLRGHGRTRLPASPDYQDSWNRHSRDIAEAVTRLAPSGTVLAGHSMGGTSALLASRRIPNLVKGLCLFDPVLAPIGFYMYAKLPWVFENWRHHFPMARNAARRRANFATRSDAIVAYTGRGAFKTWPAQTIADYCDDGFTDLADGTVTLSCEPAFEAACFAGQRHNPHAALKKINWPTKLLKGEKGSTTRGLSIAKLARYGIDIQTIAGTSHFLPMERPDVCVAVMVEVIKVASQRSQTALAA